MDTKHPADKATSAADRSGPSTDSPKVKVSRTKDLPYHLLEALSRPLSEEEYREGEAQKV